MGARESLRSGRKKIGEEKSRKKRGSFVTFLRLIPTNCPCVSKIGQYHERNYAGALAEKRSNLWTKKRHKFMLYVVKSRLYSIKSYYLFCWPDAISQVACSVLIHYSSLFTGQIELSTINRKTPRPIHIGRKSLPRHIIVWLNTVYYKLKVASNRLTCPFFVFVPSWYQYWWKSFSTNLRSLWTRNSLPCNVKKKSKYPFWIFWG